MADPYRILVTISRGWNDPAAIWHRLEVIRRQAVMRGRPLVIVHGDSDSDQVAKLFGQVHAGVTQEPWPADWSRLGRGAGPRRNQAMVDSGVAQVEAFIGPCQQRGCEQPHPHNSHGASGTAAYARRRDVPVNRHPAVPELNEETP